MELSKEVFEYAHKEVSGEYVGCTVDVALMKEHKDLKKDLLWVIEKSMFGDKAPVTTKEFYEKCQALMDKYSLKR